VSDSQCSLDTSETQPPSPKIDTSRCGLDRVHTTDEKKRRRRGIRRRGLKQTTLTQVLPDGSLSLAMPTMVGVTSGVKQVEAILSDPNSGVFLGAGEEEHRGHEEVLPSKRWWSSPDVLIGEGSQGEELDEEEEELEEGENTLVESEDEKDLQDE